MDNGCSAADVEGATGRRKFTDETMREAGVCRSKTRPIARMVLLPVRLFVRPTLCSIALLAG